MLRVPASERQIVAVVTPYRSRMDIELNLEKGARIMVLDSQSRGK